MISKVLLVLTILFQLTILETQCRLDFSKAHNALDRKEFMYHFKDAHPCRRECVEGAQPMTCHFNFHVEWYYTMSKACFDCPYNITDCDRLHCIPADGMKRAITVINRQLPGPAVDVCLGDHIIVDLHNGLMEESTSIHWHGHHQVDSPYMDGVPHLTQCPIPPRSSFRYRFHAASPGTHFWHSHTGSQRGDGAFGAFIIRKPISREVHRHLYDFDLPEHIMVMTDWSHMLGIEQFNAHHHSDGDNKPPTILMNGKGIFKEFPISGQSDDVTYTPIEVFTVRKGHSYRFRIVNSGFLNCPIELSIDNHTLTAINSDGGDIKPITVDSLVSYAGERWDFVLNANNNVSNYWIKMRGLMDCDERFTSAFQVAVLKYEGADMEDPPGVVDYDATRTTGTVLNPLNTASKQNSSILISELTTVHSTASDLRLRSEPDVQFFISYDFYELDNPHYHLNRLYGFNQVLLRTEQVRTPQMNHMSFKFPSFPLLSQRNQADDYTFCSNLTTESCGDSYCECTNVLKVPLHSVVELILIDEGVAYDANHPFHLHGHPFRVVAMERIGKTITRKAVMEMDRQGLIHRNLESAPLKDTVTVPDGGFTIIRFHATNPGYWLFHCHIEFHVETGMALVFKVGEHEDMAPVPPNFPKCDNYYYDLEEKDIAQNEITNSKLSHDSMIASSTVEERVAIEPVNKTSEQTEAEHTTLTAASDITIDTVADVRNITNTTETIHKEMKHIKEKDTPNNKIFTLINIDKHNRGVPGDSNNRMNSVPHNTVDSNNKEANDLIAFGADDKLAYQINASNKTDYGTKEESNDIPISRWFRSASSSADASSVMMKPSSLIIVGTSLVVILLVIIFLLYKACS